MLAVYFIKHRDRVSIDVTFINLVLAGVRKPTSQGEMEEYSTEGSIINPTVNTKDWPKTVKSVEEYLRMFHSVNDTPLSDVMRNQLVPTAESDDLSNSYNTINEEMIARDTIVVAGTVGTNVALESNGPFTA